MLKNDPYPSISTLEKYFYQNYTPYNYVISKYLLRIYTIRNPKHWDYGKLREESTLLFLRMDPICI